MLPAAALLAPAIARAADVQPGPGAAQIVELVFGLAVVIAAVLLSSRLLFRMQRGGGAGGAQLRVVSSLVVGQKERIVLLQAGKTQLLVGVTSAQVSTLHVLDEPIADLPAVESRVPAGGHEWLRRVLVRKT
jgi:flagellar protein FliO/FliZ